jgi:hypothetical protein
VIAEHAQEFADWRFADCKKICLPTCEKETNSVFALCSEKLVADSKDDSSHRRARELSEDLLSVFVSAEGSWRVVVGGGTCWGDSPTVIGPVHRSDRVISS